jgi:predicted DNA-binding transcriptional regulator AlpA
VSATKPAPSQGSAERLVAFDEVMRLTTLSRSRIIQLYHAGSFPLPVKVGASRVAWKLAEVEERIRQRPRVAARQAAQ